MERGDIMRPLNEKKISEVLEYIISTFKAFGEAPTVRDIAKACNIPSTSTVHSMIKILESRDQINIDKIGKKSFISVPKNLVKGEVTNASLVGTCPCGEPILAVENIEATIPLPVEIFGNGNHIILTAKGSSMIKRGIFDGDYMIVDTSVQAHVGNVVIARVNDEEATAKVLRQKNGKYYLEAANDSLDINGERIYKDIHPKGNWDIIGVVKQVIHSTDKDVL